MEFSIFIDKKMLQNSFHDAVSKVAYEINREIFYEERYTDNGKILEFEVYAEELNDFVNLNLQTKETITCYDSDSDSITELAVKYKHRNKNVKNGHLSTNTKSKTTFHDSDSDSITEMKYLGSNMENMKSESTSSSSCSSPFKMPFSYASIAKKPKPNTPENIEVKLNDRTVEIQFDSYHMILTPQVGGNIWCMACEQFETSKNKLKHCQEPYHLNNLKKCELVQIFSMHFVRKVTDDKYYHCGHCNNLKMVNTIDVHLKKKHPVKPNENYQNPHIDNNVDSVHLTSKSGTCHVENERSYIQERSNTIAPTTDPPNKITADVNITTTSDLNIFESTTDQNTVNAPVADSNNTVRDTLASSPVMEYVQNIEIYIFGYTMSLPLFSYNAITKGAGTFHFYCGLCDVFCKEFDIAVHLLEVKHAELLRHTVFLAQFNHHLIRQKLTETKYDQHIQNLEKSVEVCLEKGGGTFLPPHQQRIEAKSMCTELLVRTVFHCALCNVPVDMNIIYVHIQDQQHLINLQKALNSNFQHSQVPNMSSLPPNSAYSYSNIRNPSPYGRSQEVFNVLYTNNTFVGTPMKYHYPIHNTNPNSIHNVAINQASQNPDVGISANEGGSNISTPIEEDESESEEYPDQDGEYLDQNGESQNEDDSDFEEDFDFDAHAYLNLKTRYIKVSLTSYNTLVASGTGWRYCFVCAIEIKSKDLNEHIKSTNHLANLEKNRVLDDYGENLLRQVGLTYHCAICNILTTRKQVKEHLTWPIHVSLRAESKKFDKKKRKKEIQNGVLKVKLTTQKEQILFTSNEPKFRIIYSAVISKIKK